MITRSASGNHWSERVREWKEIKYEHRCPRGSSRGFKFPSHATGYTTAGRGESARLRPMSTPVSIDPLTIADYRGRKGKISVCLSRRLLLWPKHLDRCRIRPIYSLINGSLLLTDQKPPPAHPHLSPITDRIFPGWWRNGIFAASSSRLAWLMIANDTGVGRRNRAEEPDSSFVAPLLACSTYDTSWFSVRM